MEVVSTNSGSKHGPQYTKILIKYEGCERGPPKCWRAHQYMYVFVWVCGRLPANKHGLVGPKGVARMKAFRPDPYANLNGDLRTLLPNLIDAP